MVGGHYILSAAEALPGVAQCSINTYVHLLLTLDCCVKLQLYLGTCFFALCRNEKAGSSQRSSSVASDHSSREHKRRSSRMQDDSFHGNHRHHRHGSHHSNSHHRKRDSSHLSGEDSDQRQEKRSKGKKRKKHQHIHEDSSPEHTEDID